MRVLLDECLPRRLKNHLLNHEARTVQEMGWSAKTNGELLQSAEQQFDVLLTSDQGFPYQQNLSHAGIAILLLSVGKNGLKPLLEILPQIYQALDSIRPGQFLRISKK